MSKIRIGEVLYLLIFLFILLGYGTQINYLPRHSDQGPNPPASLRYDVQVYLGPTDTNEVVPKKPFSTEDIRKVIRFSDVEAIKHQALRFLLEQIRKTEVVLEGNEIHLKKRDIKATEGTDVGHIPEENTRPCQNRNTLILR